MNSLECKSDLAKDVGFVALNYFRLCRLRIQSQILEGNPLGDPAGRNLPVLLPRQMKPGEELPVVMVLSGYGGNGPKYANWKPFEDGFVKNLDQMAIENQAPRAIYVFIDAYTFWGGSQFINSKGTGAYEDFILKEVVASIQKNLPALKDPAYWALMGGSSGGYGALHLCSRYPDVFSLCVAISPDSFFELSLLPEIYLALPYLSRYKNLIEVKMEVISGNFLKSKNSFSVLNVIAMGLCYAPSIDHEFGFENPIDIKTGFLKSTVWQKWKEHDPIQFLPTSEDQLKKLKGIYLEAGDRDEHHLQYGLHQISKQFQESKIVHDFNIFSGYHRDLTARFPQALRWLKNNFN